MSARTIKHYQDHIAGGCDPATRSEMLDAMMDRLVDKGAPMGLFRPMRTTINHVKPLKPTTHWRGTPIGAMSTWHLLCTVAMLWRCAAAYSRGIQPESMNGEKITTEKYDAETVRPMIRAMLREVRRRDLAAQGATEDDLE